MERTRPILSSLQRPNPKAWPDRGLYAAWIGHSTVLLKIDGITILAMANYQIGAVASGFLRC
jgi:hypothetical protein